jgi:hypothetical protein
VVGESFRTNSALWDRLWRSRARYRAFNFKKQAVPPTTAI